jgi:hypothetical protein
MHSDDVLIDGGPFNKLAVSRRGPAAIQYARTGRLSWSALRLFEANGSIRRMHPRSPSDNGAFALKLSVRVSQAAKVQTHRADTSYKSSHKANDGRCVTI